MFSTYENNLWNKNKFERFNARKQNTISKNKSMKIKSNPA